ncbi:MAG: ABC transporter substrate-binding protein [Hahellaceae bacterium]|nr:ABC transporter substrate-binding protein [Hahellaceae bacterium]MCP5169046.1 ABC transporter substrate-binding protein [Hahellaceae bacterium]
MFIRSAVTTLFVIFVLLTEMVSVAHASSDNEAALLKGYIEKNTSFLVARLNEERGGYAANPEHFYNEMDKALNEVVDFRRIAAKVMGKYARQASKEQRSTFLDAFKRSLYVAYSRALVDSGEFSISVLGAEINPRSDDRASVELEVTTASGNRYPVVYSMYRKDGLPWLIENVIVQGVNIGLVFRDRFEQEVRTNKGDLNKVISGWSSQLDNVDQLKTTQKSEDVE